MKFSQTRLDLPSVSAKQHRFMEAAAHNPKFAAEAGIKQSVASEFVQADMAKGKDSKIAKMLKGEK